jgi:hypothetical protein
MVVLYLVHRGYFPFLRASGLASFPRVPPLASSLYQLHVPPSPNVPPPPSSSGSLLALSCASPPVVPLSTFAATFP